MRVNGCVTRSLSESIGRSGMRNDFSIPRTSITTGATFTAAQANSRGFVDSRLDDVRLRFSDHEARCLPPLRGARRPPGCGAGLADQRAVLDRLAVSQLQRAARLG